MTSLVVAAFVMGSLSGSRLDTSVSSLSVGDLTCEFARNPLGIDAVRPRLGWTLESASEHRGAAQQGYRLLVASSRQQLNRGEGDLWDSGEVVGGQQNSIAYRGVPLRSGQTCFWKVRVRDQSGSWSGWSPVAQWEMGLLRASDWTAQWLNDGKPVPTSDAAFYEDDPAPLFRKEFSTSRKIARARLYVSGLGYYEAALNGKRVGDHVLDPGWPAYENRVLYCTYDVTKMLAQGKNCLGVSLGNGWFNPLPLKMWGNRNIRDTLTVGRPRFIAQLHIDYADGGQ